jgi:drug/metabolite transporter (DMT)-like permease
LVRAQGSGAPFLFKALKGISVNRILQPLERRSFLIALLLIIDSLHFVFARLLLPHIQPGSSAMYVMAIGTLQVGLFGMFGKRLQIRVLIQNIRFFISIGFLIAVSTIINYEAVAFIDPGTATMLGRTTILFSICLGMFWLKERLSRIQIIGSLVALGGVITITFQPADYLLMGSLMILGSALMYALHAAIIKRYSQQMDFVNFFFFRLLSTTGILFLLALGRKTLILPSASTWLLLILVGTVDVTISRALYYLALRRLTVSIHAIIMNLSPVVAVIWSLFLFGDLPNRQQFIGGAAVVAGVVLVMLAENKRR